MLFRSGITPSSRLAAAVLAALNLGEWITATDQDYVGKAVAAAADVARLVDLRRGLRSRIAQSPLAPEAYARSLEDVLLRIAG